MILFLDSNALIYQYEGSPTVQKAVTEQVRRWAGRGAQTTPAVSRLAVMECCVKPLREGNAALLARYRQLFAATAIIELDAAVIDTATQLRATHGLKTPDALHAACALTLAAPYAFVSGDKAFQRVTGLPLKLLAI